MKILVDSNILLRMAQPGHTMHVVAASEADSLVKQGHALHIIPQNIYEF